MSYYGITAAEVYELRAQMNTLKSHPKFEQFFRQAKDYARQGKIEALEKEIEDLKKTVQEYRQQKTPATS